MGLKEVLVSLNNLKAEGVIQDYAIGGGYAAMFYNIPMTTYDLDVLAILPSEKDYHNLYEHFRGQGARIEDMPVQFLPNYISPLFNSAIENANIVEFEGLRTKFVSVEYLIFNVFSNFCVIFFCSLYTAIIIVTNGEITSFFTRLALMTLNKKIERER